MEGGHTWRIGAEDWPKHMKRGALKSAAGNPCIKNCFQAHFGTLPLLSLWQWETITCKLCEKVHNCSGHWLIITWHLFSSVPSVLRHSLAVMLTGVTWQLGIVILVLVELIISLVLMLIEFQVIKGESLYILWFNNTNCEACNLLFLCNSGLSFGFSGTQWFKSTWWTGICTFLSFLF